MKKSIRNLDDLLKQNLVKENDLPKLKQVVENFSFAISDQMQKLIDKKNPHDPIAQQFIPSAEELLVSPYELADPIGDEIHKNVKGIIHRYPDRCLFTPVHVCPVYCRFCFRREKIGSSNETLTPAELEDAFSYLESHSEIWEVILTGGDPLILKPTLLSNLLKRLCAIKHVEVIRIHTRVPVVESHRINDAMISALKCGKPVYVAIHANHPTEFTADAEKACASLVDVGIPLLSQTTLLKNLNDNIETLSTLMRCFIKNRIKPYYLHQGDLARGTQHFRTTIEKGQALMRQLRGRFSGLCQPTYVLDIPGGFGKMPVGPCYINASAEKPSMYDIEDYQGNIHAYPIQN